MKGVPSQFSLLPKAGFEIRPVEAFRAKSAAGGEYQSPSEDGRAPASSTSTPTTCPRARPGTRRTCSQ